MLKYINDKVVVTAARPQHLGRLAGLIMVAASVATPSVAEDVQVFDLAVLEQMRDTDPVTLELVLNAMHDGIFFTEQSVERPVLCASPIPLPLDGLLEAIDAEIAEPTHPNGASYGPTDRVAFVYLNALRAQKTCQ